MAESLRYPKELVKYREAFEKYSGATKYFYERRRGETDPEKEK